MFPLSRPTSAGSGTVSCLVDALLRISCPESRPGACSLGRRRDVRRAGGRAVTTPVLLAALVLVVASCGGAARPSARLSVAPSNATASGGTGPSPTGTAPSAALPDRWVVDDGYQGRFRATATVLQGQGHGPQLCLGAIAASLPPQCGGPPVVGWSWEAVRHEGPMSGVTWGTYVVVGHYDGTSFTLTQPASVPDPHAMPAPDDEATFDTPCPPPPGGWRPPDRRKATMDAFGAAAELVQHLDGFGSMWIDDRVEVGTPNTSGSRLNDPARFVLNVSTTRDVAAMERAVRSVWGGSLCVSRAPRTNAELAATVTALSGPPGVLTVMADERKGQVVLTVVRATQHLRRDLDRRFGPEAVRLLGALQPID